MENAEQLPSIAVDVESESTNTAEGEGQANQEGYQDLAPTNTAEGERQANQEGYQDLALLGVYFAAAGAAVQALQTKGPLPISSQLVCVALVLALTAFLCGVHKFVSKGFFRVGILLGATGLVVALVRNLHPLLMGATVAIYAFAIVAIIFRLV